MSSEDLTELLRSALDGDESARERASSLVYGELERLARGQLARGARANLGTGSLVHEAYLRLFGDAEVEVRDRSHFWALSARVMRQVLVDHFRRSVADKRGGPGMDVSLDRAAVVVGAGDETSAATVLAVHEALQHLDTIQPRLARVVECRFFAGMSHEEVAEALDTSPRTARRDWAAAKAWLADRLKASSSASPSPGG